MLDRIAVTTDEQDQIVGEANVAFVLNMRIFEELDVLSGVKGAEVRPLESALSWRSTWKEPGAEGGEVRSGCAAMLLHTACLKTLTNNFPSPPPPSTQCPFGFTGPNPHGPAKSVSAPAKKEVDSKKHDDSARCPWPFIFFHDPGQGFRDWQTWALVGLGTAFVYNRQAIGI